MIIRRRSIRVEIEQKTQRVEFLASPDSVRPADITPAKTATQALLNAETPRILATHITQEEHPASSTSIPEGTRNVH